MHSFQTATENKNENSLFIDQHNYRKNPIYSSKAKKTSTIYTDSIFRELSTVRMSDVNSFSVLTTQSQSGQNVQQSHISKYYFPWFFSVLSSCHATPCFLFLLFTLLGDCFLSLHIFHFHFFATVSWHVSPLFPPSPFPRFLFFQLIPLPPTLLISLLFLQPTCSTYTLSHRSLF